jgi:hypothetical protein
MVLRASGDVAEAAENAFALYMNLTVGASGHERYSEGANIYAEHTT